MPKGKIGIELGTSYLRICANDKDDILQIKNVIALNNKMKLVAVGNEAYAMYEKEPYTIQVISPMTHGVIGDYTNMRRLLHVVLNSYTKRFRSYSYYAAVPVDISNIEKRAFYDMILEAGVHVKAVDLLAKPMLDAVGLGISVEEPKGSMILNLGTDTCEISVVCLGGVVCSRLLKCGSSQLDSWMMQYMRRQEGIQIGKKTAEKFKYQYAKSQQDKTFFIKGRDVVSGLPKGKKIPLSVMERRTYEFVHQVIAETKDMLERIPPQLVSDIMAGGIFLSGGGSNFFKVKSWMEEELNLPVHTRLNPENTVIQGLKVICNQKNDR